MVSQDGLGTGAPFYRTEEKKDVKPTEKKGEKAEEKEKDEKVEEKGEKERELTEDEEGGSAITKRKGRKESSKKSSSHLKARFLFYHSNDGNMWLSPLKGKGGSNSPSFFREKCANNENDSSKCFYTNSFKKVPSSLRSCWLSSAWRRSYCDWGFTRSLCNR
jgi:hypothetical protein